MRIRRLQVQNVRSLRSVDIELSHVCALVGPNNAGKSNFLLAIKRVLGRDWVTVNAFDESDVYARDPKRDIRIQVSLDPPIPYTKLKGTDPARIATLFFEYTRYKVGPQKGERRLEQRCFDAKGKPSMVLAKAAKAGEQRQYQPLVNVPADVRENIPLIYIGTNRSLRDQ